jgi:hypothetical protein
MEGTPGSDFMASIKDNERMHPFPVPLMRTASGELLRDMRSRAWLPRATGIKSKDPRSCNLKQRVWASARDIEAKSRGVRSQAAAGDSSACGLNKART